MNKILLQSFKDCKRLKSFKFCGGISGVATLILFFKDLTGITTILEAIGAFLLLTVCVYLLYFLFRLIYNTIVWFHSLYVDSIWGKAIVDLKDLNASIHRVERQESISSEDIATLLSNFCNKVKLIFDRITKANCCVSIKVPVADTSSSTPLEMLVFKNAARDQGHLSERDTDEYKNIQHTVIGNTAYSRVISLVIKETSKLKIYLNNNIDIEKDPNYATTSCCSSRNVIPYKSELVVPIIPVEYKKLDEIVFSGFLCIDCDKKNSFDANRYDVHMAISLADSLYSLMLKLRSFQ